MYSNVHNSQYRTLPINLIYAFGDIAENAYPDWFIHSQEKGRIHCFTKHRHETLELILLLDGSLNVQLEDRPRRIGRGDMIIINPFVDHAADFRVEDGNLSYVCVQIELSFFAPSVQGALRDCMNQVLLRTGHFSEYISAAHPAMHAVRDVIEGLMALWDEDAGAYNECRQMAVVYELLSLLIRHFYIDKPLIDVGNRDMRFIRRVTDYLDRHHAEELSTSIVSKALSYNPNHFCRLFRANFNDSFSHYLCEYRITKALLRYNGSSMLINEIAAAVGFRDYGYFAKEFKKYTGITPAAFFLGRKK